LSSGTEQKQSKMFQPCGCGSCTRFRSPFDVPAIIEKIHFPGDASPSATTTKGLHGTSSESVARTHRPAAESYDHAVRDDRESDRIKGYIENNPVKAGLVANAEDYLWSSAARKAGRVEVGRGC
jgi:hypothetical protein